MRKFFLSFFLLSVLCFLRPAKASEPYRPVVLFKRAPNQVLVWAYDSKSEKPLAGSEVAIYEPGRRLIASGQTNRDGIFSISISPTEAKLLSSVRKDGQTVFCAESWRGGLNFLDFQALPEKDSSGRYKVYFHTNHFFYQAGQKVRFRAILRESDTSLPPPSRTPVRIRVVHSAGYVLYDKTPLTDRFGSVSGTAPLPEDLPSGQCFLEAELEGERHFTTFQLREKPGQDYSLRWETAPAGYSSGQDIEANLWATYPAGAPAARLPLRWKMGLFSPSAGYWKLTEGTGNTDENGRLKITVPGQALPEKESILILEAIGRDVRASRAAFLRSPWKIFTERRSYLPGEEARLFIQTPYERGVALITVERERIFHSQVVEVRGGSATLSLAIKEYYRPNIFIGVAFLPLGRKKPEGFLADYVELAVDSQENRLDISLITSKESYRPGEEVSCTILTRDGWGRPVSAELSLAVVEGPGYVLGRKEDIDEAWRRRLPLKVHTAQSLPAGRAIYSAMKPEIFAPSLYWQPRLITDENGEAHFSFSLSEPGSWRIVAQGVTAEAGRGAAFADIIVEPRLTLHPALPRFLRRGDKAEFGIFLQNWSEEPEEISLALGIEGLEISGELTRTVVISPGQGAQLSWPVGAGSTPSAKITASIVGSDFAEEWRAELPILPFGEIKEAFDSNLAWPGRPAVLALGLPQEAVSAEMEIRICPSLSARLMDELAELRAELYPDPEELAAYLLAALSLENALDGPPKDKLVGSIEEALEHLHRLQKETYFSAFVLQALEQARRAGFAVSEEDLQIPQRQCFHSLISELADGERKVSPCGQACLALSLNSLGEHQAAHSLIAELASQAITTKNLARWEGGAFSDRYNTAQVLQALLALDPKNPLLPKAFNWLTNVHWRTSQEKAATISALAAYLAAEKPAPAEGLYHILLNGQLLAEGAFSGQETLACRTFATEALKTGDNEVQIVLEGEGIIYGTALLRYRQDLENLEATRSLNGLSLQRRYLGGAKPLTECALGDIIEVEIMLEASRPTRQVLVRDSLPAGFEAVNDSLRGGGTWLGRRGDKVAFLIPYLGSGQHTFVYAMRATTVGRFRAMPAEALSLYAPERWGRSASAELMITALPSP